MTLAVVALCLALGGGAYAAGVKLKANSVKTKNLKAGAVTEPKIANGAVTKAKLAAGAVTSSPLVSSAANNNSALTAAADITVAQLGGIGGAGTLNTSSLTTPNRTIVAQFSSNVFASAASNIQCKLQQALNGGGFTDVPSAATNTDVAAVAPAGGADDAAVSITSTIVGANGTVDIRAICNSFNANGSATFNNLSVVAYPRP